MSGHPCSSSNMAGTASPGCLAAACCRCGPAARARADSTRCHRWLLPCTTTLHNHRKATASGRPLQPPPPPPRCRAAQQASQQSASTARPSHSHGSRPSVTAAALYWATRCAGCCGSCGSRRSMWQRLQLRGTSLCCRWRALLTHRCRLCCRRCSFRPRPRSLPRRWATTGSSSLMAPPSPPPSARCRRAASTWCAWRHATRPARASSACRCR